MKKGILIAAALLMTMSIFAQVDSTSPAPAYKRFPTFPPVKLLLPDSSSHFTKDDLPKKTAVMLMIFNPACEHCQHETEEITKNMDRLKDVQIVMASTQSLEEIRKFITTYHLDQYKNIIVGQDDKYFLPVFYMIRNLPYLAMYDKKGKLLDSMEGSRHIDDIAKVFE